MRMRQIQRFLKNTSCPHGIIRKNSYHPFLNLMAALGYEDSGNGWLAVSHVISTEDVKLLSREIHIC